LRQEVPRAVSTVTVPLTNDVTRILSAAEQGDPHAAEQLLPLVYDELRKLAAQKLAQEAPGQTLQATALVHEAYLQLVEPVPGKGWNSRGHFFAAAEAMRRILVDQARRRHAAKRGGQAARVELHESVIAGPEPDEEILSLHEALDQQVLKPGMDSRQVIARFEAERQALALMDHPHIAKVHDGGTTASGRPYFVMELVKGVPLTDYCDRERLTTRQRLGLFRDVCRAVQHAHQKGIIHRDLKPSNILVTVHDTTPVVEVIDFGIAKATGQQLTEKTLNTGFAQLVGTPLYMSPEQAGLSGLDVDTRSDVYSLGVLLYELLTGTTPFESERLRRAGYDEMRRIFREDEPPKPSTRLSTLANAALATVAERRAVEPWRLCR
jgi:RNA polymerase sigma factor (TIGR02999 family)